MAESVIWQIEAPKLTIEEVLQAEGADYHGRPPRPSTQAVRQKMLEEAAKYVQPQMIWRELKITGWEEQKILLGGTHCLHSKLLARVTKRAEKLILYLLTLGPKLDQRMQEYKVADKVLEAYALDVVGTASIMKTSHIMVEKLKQSYHHQGLETTFSMGPGHSYWPSLDDIEVIFNLLQGEKIGLHLTESKLLLPRKSMGMVFGVGQNFFDFHNRTHCDFCNLHASCQLSSRRAEK